MTLNLNENNFEFLKQLIQMWEGPGEYRVERIAGHDNPTTQRVTSISPAPRHRIYREAILTSLLNLGGQAHVSQLKPLILNGVKPQLTARELNDNKSNRPFWWYDCQVERHDLVLEGLIEDNTSVGYWSLTKKGQQAAQAIV